MIARGEGQYVGPKTCASVLEFVDWHLCRSGGVSPTFTEIMDGCGIGSKATVSTALKALREGGFVRLGAAGRQQCIEVVAPRYRRPDVGAIYAALGSTPIGKIGDGRKVAA